MSIFFIWVAAIVGVVASLGLVAIGGRHRRRFRSRPAPEDLDARRRTLRSIAANDYHRQTKHEQE